MQRVAELGLPFRCLEEFTLIVKTKFSGVVESQGEEVGEFW